MKEFKNYHPVVNFTYFLFVLGFSMFFMHPICLMFSLVGSFCYSVMLKGKNALKTNSILVLSLMVIMSLVNSLVNHRGVTILAYLPDGNPLTMESLFYGVAAAVMIVSVILWFSCYNEIMTSDKVVYLFGKVMPSLSLIFSMTLRFVPRFIRKLKEVTAAQKCIGNDVSSGNLIRRAKCGLSIISVLLTWSMENAVETADSMRARGYGLKGRTAFSIFSVDRRDKTALLIILVLGLYIVIGGMFGNMDFEYFPYVGGTEITPLGISFFAAYFVLCVYPIMIEVWEVARWKYLISKI